MRSTHHIFSILLIGLAALAVCHGVTIETPEGMWPSSWPKELEPLRKQARTVSVRTNVYEMVHEISFKKRENFENAWPHILKLKSKGAPLVLEKSPFKYPVSEFESTSDFLIPVPNRAESISGVMILAPTGAYVGLQAFGRVSDENSEAYKKIETLIEQGKLLQTSPPWRKYLYSDKGELPEYVALGGEYGSYEWVPAHADYFDRGGIDLYRARVDIILIADGKVIDLNRLQMPANTPIIDNRFKQGHNQPLKATR